MSTLHYDPHTGAFTRNGKPAGTVGPNGYAYVRHEGRQVLAHRLAWFFVHGCWPALHIDHLDGNPLNNAIANLRDVDRATNMQNRRAARRGNSVGLLGVTRCNGRFRASICVERRQVHIGMFDTAEEAHAAYLTHKRQLHPGCTI
jgi:hypothetical protein